MDLEGREPEIEYATGHESANAIALEHEGLRAIAIGHVDDGVAKSDSAAWPETDSGKTVGQMGIGFVGSGIGTGWEEARSGAGAAEPGLVRIDLQLIESCAVQRGRGLLALEMAV